MEFKAASPLPLMEGKGVDKKKELLPTLGYHTMKGRSTVKDNLFLGFKKTLNIKEKSGFLSFCTAASFASLIPIESGQYSRTDTVHGRNAIL